MVFFIYFAQIFFLGSSRSQGFFFHIGKIKELIKNSCKTPYFVVKCRC